MNFPPDLGIAWLNFQSGESISDEELVLLIESAKLLEQHMPKWGKAGVANCAQILHDRYILEGYAAARQNAGTWSLK